MYKRIVFLNFSRCLIALVTQTAVTDSKPCGVHNYSLQTNQPGPVLADIFILANSAWPSLWLMVIFEKVIENECINDRHSFDCYWMVTGKQCEIGCKLVFLSTRSCIRAFNWHQNQWPCMTTNGVRTADTRYLCGSWTSCSISTLGP